jgi:NADPH-dependent glutamate synthase beta subunit-like oxidoreductase
VIVLGGGNTAMDCCRSSKRLGGSDVKVIVRSPFEEMKASPWEKEDAIHEGIPILDCLVPKAFLHTDGKLTGMSFDKVRAVRDEKGRASSSPPASRAGVRMRRRPGRGRPGERLPLDRARPRPRLRRMGHAGARPGDAAVEPAAVFFGGDAALGPKNIIWAVAQGHAAAISIDKFLNGEDVSVRPAPG